MLSCQKESEAIANKTEGYLNKLAWWKQGYANKGSDRCKGNDVPLDELEQFQRALRDEAAACVDKAGCLVPGWRTGQHWRAFWKSEWLDGFSGVPEWIDWNHSDSSFLDRWSINGVRNNSEIAIRVGCDGSTDAGKKQREVCFVLNRRGRNARFAQA